MNPLYPYTVKNINTLDIPKRCSKCNVDLYVGDQFRATKDRRDKFCAKCVGFYLSRYNVTWKIKSPSLEERFWQEYFNEEIREKILAGICG